jgi:hypothetical protein
MLNVRHDMTFRNNPTTDNGTSILATRCPSLCIRKQQLILAPYARNLENLPTSLPTYLESTSFDTC